MKTVFITGASSGIGKETAKIFQKSGWNVIATMRNPKTENELTKLKNVSVIKCDVTDQNSINTAVAEGFAAFNGIDVLVNNAGFYSVGPLEAATHEQIKRQIDTNLLGLINVTNKVIPFFRKQKSGTIINLSSIAGIISIPLQTLYHATKWGVEGFSEALRYELQPFNVHVKIIEPGVINTDLWSRSITILKDDTLTEYEFYSQKIIGKILKNGANGSSPKGVAEIIYKAATDNSKKLRYPAGKSKELIFLRKIMPLGFFVMLIKKFMGV